MTTKTSSGSNVSTVGLKAGMIVAGYVSGSTFRLLTDQASAAIVADAEAAADRAEMAAASVAALVAPADLTALAALTAAQVTVGTSIEVRSSPGRFRVLAGSATSNGYTAD